MTVNPEDLVRCLRTVPEKHLRIVELTRELATRDGDLNVEEAAARADEVEAAVHEAQAYAQATRRVLRWLIELAH